MGQPEETPSRTAATARNKQQNGQTPPVAFGFNHFSVSVWVSVPVSTTVSVSVSVSVSVLVSVSILVTISA